MSESRDDRNLDLKELASRLTLEGMPTQTDVAIAAGVSQATVSRAMREQIKGASKAARKLWQYTSERMRVLREGQIGRQDAPTETFLTDPRRRSHGNADTAANLNRRDAGRQRAAPLPRRRAEPLESDTVDDRKQLADIALAGLRAYLADAFDPLIVIEQLAVLRRAQDPTRRRRTRAVDDEGVD
jgi:hypothetical protein